MSTRCFRSCRGVRHRPAYQHIALSIVVAVCAAACSRPIQTARRSSYEPPTDTEVRDQIAVHSARCSKNWSLLFPGLGHACLGRPVHAGVFASMMAAEVGTAVLVYDRTEDSAHPGVQVPVLAATDLWIYGVLDPVFVGQRGSFKRLVPQDSPQDLVAAPFNWEVLKKPTVWAGLAGFLALGIGASLLLERDKIDTTKVGDDANLFGQQAAPSWGYPAAFATGVGLFGHVGIAEEALFRGYIQSGLARRAGEGAGWILGSLIFGAAHIPNAFALTGQERDEYLLYGIPVITAGGLYLGWLYRHEGYSLAPPVAVHFWYDLLLSATFFALDPQESLLSAKISLPF